MKERDWVSLHKKIQSNWLWKERRTFSKAEAWIDLLLRSTHSGEKFIFNGDREKIKRGEIITSLLDLATTWRWNKTKVVRFLKILEVDSMIAIETTTNRTKITISNYNNYQPLKEGEKKKPKKDIPQRKQEFQKLIEPYLKKYSKELCNTFYFYWTEHGENDSKMRFEKQASFGMGQRLSTFKKNQKKFDKSGDNQQTSKIPIV